jgi:peptide/nickel transport system permease protein
VLALRRFAGSPSGAIALGLLAIMAAVMALAPSMLDEAANLGATERAREGASLAHPLGNDALGRDMLARILMATRLTITLSVSAVLISAVLGYGLGLLAALGGRRLRQTSRGMLYLALAFPPIVVALVICAAVGASAGAAVTAVGIAFVPLYARTMMNLAETVGYTDYVQAAKMLGISRTRLVLRHIAPNVAGPLWIQATVGLGEAMVGISTLSFLGLGVPAPLYDWGSLLADSLNQVFTSPEVVAGPALAITLTGVLFAFVGEVGARSMDPRRWTRDRGGQTAAAESVPSGIPEDPPLSRGRVAGEAAEAPDAEVILEVRKLRIEFGDPGHSVPVVEDLSFRLNRGDTLGLVGESGSGKSMTALAVAGLLPHPGRATSEVINFHGRNLGETLPGNERERLLGTELGMIFQDPMASLTPTLRIGSQLCEEVRHHRGLSRAQARQLALETLREVQMPSPERVLKSYPHQLSGGMRQRIAIAMALMVSPSLLIADEPTTALDVTIRAEIMSLLERLRSERKLTTLFISHDIGTVRRFCDRVLVMYQGRIVEELSSGDLGDAQHPYTQALMAAVPEIGVNQGPALTHGTKEDRRGPEHLNEPTNVYVEGAL